MYTTEQYHLLLKMRNQPIYDRMKITHIDVVVDDIKVVYKIQSELGSDYTSTIKLDTITDSEISILNDNK